MNARKKQQRLQPALNAAQKRCDEAAELVNQARRVAEQQKQQIDQLHDYRRDYCARLNDLGKSGITSRQLRDFNDFINGLDGGIHTLQGHLEKLSCEEENRRHQWRQAYLRTQMLDTVMVRYRNEQRHHEDRVQQCENDEFGCIAAAKRRIEESDHE